MVVFTKIMIFVKTLYLFSKIDKMSTKILIIGACGQIGTELTQKLRKIYGTENVIASDIRKLNIDVVNSGPFEVVNALDFNQIQHLVEVHQIDEVYLMAALLSATAEKNPAFAWDLNMNSLFHVLNLAKAGKIKKIFWNKCSFLNLRVIKKLIFIKKIS